MRGKHVAFEIKSLHNEIKRLFDRNVFSNDDTGLTGMQYGMLKFIGDRQAYGDVYQRDIEAEFNIRRSTASGMMAHLEKNNYIVRSSVSGDARLKKIVLTSKAEHVNEAACANLLVIEEKLTKGIKKEEMEQFYSVLRKIAENAK